MLKACWDCVAGYSENRDRGENGGAYGIRLNDAQRAPPWPKPTQSNDIMFLLPRALRSGDSIGVSGIMTSDKQRFTVNLIAGYNATDYENTACQLEVNFTQDRVTLRIIHNGVSEQIQGDYESLPASAWFTSANFNFTFKASIEGYDGGHLLDIFIGESFLEQITLRHNIEDIRFLTLQGDIEKVMELDFKFS